MADRIIDEFAEYVPTVMPPAMCLGNIALGVAGEAGEFADWAKKYLYHGVAANWTAMDKEAGDVLWYIQAYCIWRGRSMESLMADNMTKLRSRYPDGFVRGGGIR